MTQRRQRTVRAEFPRLLAELEEHFKEAERLTQVIRERLQEIANGNA